MAKLSEDPISPEVETLVQDLMRQVVTMRAGVATDADRHVLSIAMTSLLAAGILIDQINSGAKSLDDLPGFKDRTPS